MKALFDRMDNRVHYHRMVGKNGVSVSTAGGSGTADITQYLKNTFSLMGTHVAGITSTNLSEGLDAFNKAITETISA